MSDSSTGRVRPRTGRSDTRPDTDTDADADPDTADGRADGRADADATAAPSEQDGDLAAERRHLDRSRAALVAMRAETERMGDASADQLTAWSLGALRARRLAAIDGAADAPPFFGRLDWDADRGEQPCHVGRRHVRLDAGGEPLVVDWRAPLARAFYRANPAERMGVARRRRFGFARGELTSYEDEWLAGTGAGGGADGPAGRILREEIERPRVGPMRDIVATIQPDQDDLVRADLDRSICVQGAPGTGKTAVGLHRAAYLLYTHPDRLRRSGVLVVGPNRAFLRYIAAVLPALGESGVDQVTVDELVGAGVAVRGADGADVARLKGDARLAVVLRRALYAGVGRATEPVTVPVGARRYRVPPERLRRFVDDLRRGGVRYGAARERLRALVVQDVRRQWEADGGAPSERDARRIAASPPVRGAVDALWPGVRPAALLAALLSDRDALAHAAAGVLDDGEVDALVWERRPRTPRWSAADGVLVDEIAGLLDRTPGYGHVVLDEAQDLSAMQCRAVARRCHGSFTVLGDLAQATAPWGARAWADVLGHLGCPDAAVELLTRGYRVPGEVLDLANALLPHVAPGLVPATAARRGGEALVVDRVGSDVAAAAAGHARAALRGAGSVGVVCADAAVPTLSGALAVAGLAHDVLGGPADARGHGQDAGRAGEQRLSLVAATLVKGLEFDHVVVVEPADIVAAEARGLARLYVALTRAVSRLVVVHHAPLPPELG